LSVEPAKPVTTAQFLAGYMAKLVGKQLEAAQRRADKRQKTPRYVAIKKEQLFRPDRKRTEVHEFGLESVIVPGQSVYKRVTVEVEGKKVERADPVYLIHVATLNWSRNKTIQINGRQYAAGPGKREQERDKRQRHRDIERYAMGEISVDEMRERVSALPRSGIELL
jgi:hypothetical protein